MRYRELTEAPIVDYEVVDQSTTARNSFDSPDMKLINSEKAKARMFRAFTRTPHNFHIIFVPNQQVNHDNPNITDVIFDYNAGIYDSHEFSGVEVKGEKGMIKVMMMGNISPIDKIPMTPWTLAHKIGHSFQDGVGSLGDRIDDQIDQIDTLLGTQQGRFQPQQSPEIMMNLTMRSAQSGKLSNPFEVFPEVIAQYLITGRVTITDHEELSRELTREIYKLFQLIDGKVIVEV